MSSVRACISRQRVTSFADFAWSICRWRASRLATIGSRHSISSFSVLAARSFGSAIAIAISPKGDAPITGPWSWGTELGEHLLSVECDALNIRRPVHPLARSLFAPEEHGAALFPSVASCRSKRSQRGELNVGGPCRFPGRGSENLFQPSQIPRSPPRSDTISRRARTWSFDTADFQRLHSTSHRSSNPTCFERTTTSISCDVRTPSNVTFVSA